MKKNKTDNLDLVVLLQGEIESLRSRINSEEDKKFGIRQS